jgi:hypothetical protein
MGTRVAMNFDELLQQIEECRASGAGRVWIRALIESVERESRPPPRPREWPGLPLTVAAYTETITT